MVKNEQKKKKSTFVKSVFTLLSGTTIAQAIPILASPILTRIYTPEDFGLLALYLSMVAIMGVAITARYELAIMLPRDNKDALNLVVLSIFISLVISIIVFILVLIKGKSFSGILGNESIYPWLFLVPFSLLLTGIYQSFNYWSNRNKKYKRLAVNRVVQSTTTAGTNLGIGIFKNGPFGLIFGNVIAHTMATLRLSIKSIKQEKISLSDISMNRIKYLAKRYSQFPKVSVWSALLNSSSSQMPIFILGAFFSSTIVGWYSLAHRVLKMPMTVLGSAVGQVFFQSSSSIRQDDPSQLKGVTYKAYKNMFFIGLVPMAIIFGFGDILFSFIFGESWVNAGHYSRLLSAWLLLVFVSSPLSLLFTVLEKEGIALLFNTAIFLSRVISLLIGAILFKDALITVLLFALSGVVFWLWHCLYILKMVGISYIKSFAFTMNMIIATFGISLLTRYLFLQNLW